MKTKHFNIQKVFFKAVVMGVICLFSVNTVSPLLPQKHVLQASALQVQLRLKPLLNIVFQEHKTQVMSEFYTILAMALKNIPVHDINSALDISYAASATTKRKKRVLEVISVEKGEKTVINLGMLEDLQNRPTFRITTACKSLDDILMNEGEVRVDIVRPVNNFIVTIDGPSGAGKSVVAQEVARKIGAVFYSYGKVYRLITYFALKENISLSRDIQPAQLYALVNIAQDIKLDRFRSYEVNGKMSYFYGDIEITDIFFSKEIVRNVPFVAAIPEVRKIVSGKIKEEIKRFRQQGYSVVLEGRVTSTEIAPDAEVKIHLTADVKKRARRRAMQMIYRDGLEVVYRKMFGTTGDAYRQLLREKTSDGLVSDIIEQVRIDLENRDRLDKDRKQMMVTKPAGAVEIDNTSVALGETIQKVLRNIKNIMPRHSEDSAFFKFSPVIAGAAFYKLREEAAREVEEAISRKAGSIFVDRKSGRKRYFTQGTTFSPLQANVYVMEGEAWHLPCGVELPSYMGGIINTGEGALMLTTGPFYVKEEDAPFARYIRPLSDQEVYERFGLRRVYGTDGQPFNIPVLGVGGRSLLLPVPYSVATVKEANGIRVVKNRKDYQDETLNKMHFFGIEFKNVGATAYTRHNISRSFPSTVFTEHVGKPGIFLDWWHQLQWRSPVGLGTHCDRAQKRERQVLARGADLTRWTLGVLPLDYPYMVSLRVPVGDYRRLSVFFDENGNPKKEKFYAIIEELGMTVEDYLLKLAGNYGKSLRGLVESGIIQSGHGSIVNSDIFGWSTDLEDFFEVEDGNEAFFGPAVCDWVDNLVKVLRIAGPEHRAEIDRALGEFANAFFGGPGRVRGVKFDSDNTGQLKDSVVAYARSIVRTSDLSADSSDRTRMADSFADITRRGSTRERKIEKTIKDTNAASLLMFSRLEEYIRESFEEAETGAESPSIDIAVDLSLIPKQDLRENVETWAYLILLCRRLDNVNFIFERPYPIDAGSMPAALLEDVRNAAGETEFLEELRRVIREKAGFFSLDEDIEELLDSRINAGRREDAVEIPILSKAWLEWARDNDIGLKPNQYPVALDGFTTVKDRGIALRNLEAALIIGLSKAALVIAQRKDAEKGEEREEEFMRLIKETRMLPRLQALYDIFFRQKGPLTLDTIRRMIYPDSTVRLNLAIALALPSITRMEVEKLQEFHESIQLFLHAA